MGLVDVYKQIRPAIVAFAPKEILHGETYFQHVFGTGFIIGDSLIATNAHVARLFEQYRDNSGHLRVVAILLARHPLGLAPIMLNVVNASVAKSVLASGIYYCPSSADVAVVSVDCKGMGLLALNLNSGPIEEGTPVATAGFPLGSELMHLEGQLDHLSPTLQSGIVSAVLPFPGTAPHGYLINVMSHGGCSGSPVFISDSGEVIGILYARRFEHEAHSQTMMPTNLSPVVPSYFLAKLLEGSIDQLLAGIPENAPSLDDILASMPEQLSQKFTEGLYVNDAKE